MFEFLLENWFHTIPPPPALPTALAGLPLFPPDLKVFPLDQGNEAPTDSRTNDGLRVLPSACVSDCEAKRVRASVL